MRPGLSLGLVLFLVAAGCGGEASANAVDLDGYEVRLFSAEQAGFEVLFFVDPECPIANKFAPEVQRIASEYGARGVGFHLVYADATVGEAAIRQHLSDYGYGIPALIDRSHALVGLAGASVTPEAALFSAAGELLYLGRIDDRFVDFGKEREQPTRRDLRLALDAVLAGEQPREPRTEAVGCFIPDP